MARKFLLKYFVCKQAIHQEIIKGPTRKTKDHKQLENDTRNDDLYTVKIRW